jgi:hypothetical protein
MPNWLRAANWNPFPEPMLKKSAEIQTEGVGPRLRRFGSSRRPLSRA